MTVTNAVMLRHSRITLSTSSDHLSPSQIHHHPSTWTLSTVFVSLSPSRIAPMALTFVHQPSRLYMRPASTPFQNITTPTNQQVYYPVLIHNIKTCFAHSLSWPLSSQLVPLKPQLLTSCAPTSHSHKCNGGSMSSGDIHKKFIRFCNCLLKVLVTTTTTSIGIATNEQIV